MVFKKTFEKINQDKVFIYLLDNIALFKEGFEKATNEIAQVKNQHPLKPLLVIGNKEDQLSDTQKQDLQQNIPEALLISAKAKTGIETLKEKLTGFVLDGSLKNDETIVTNSRHYDSLQKSLEQIQNVQGGMQANLSGDLLAIDLREALFHLGNITGEVTNDELLGNIFANFCIGK